MPNRIRPLAAILIVLFCAATGLSQTTWYVPDDFRKIQSAFDSNDVLDGDTIVVRPGTYLEQINFTGKTVTLKSELGPETTVINGNGPGATVVIYTGEGNDTVLEGFTITHQTAYYGSGIQITDTSPTVRNCVIKNNKDYWYPGGIYCWYGSPVIMDCVIEKNQSDLYEGSAGGLYFNSGAPVVTHCEINENSAEWYGGACFTACDATISNCTFYKNQSGEIGGGMGCYSCPSITISDCTFIENYSYSPWPSGTLRDGAIGIFQSSPAIRNCTFIRNSAKIGGAVGIVISHPTFTNCFFSGNAAEEGAAILISSTSSTTMMNCSFYGNVATSQGAAMFISGNSEIDAADSIFWGDSPDEIYLESGAVGAFTYCDIEGGLAGEGNIDQDPLYADPNNHDLHLTWRSPCINRGTLAGAPDEDLDHDLRPFMGLVDMGADEFTGVHPLEADAFSIPLAGGAVHYTLEASVTNSGRYYLILSSQSGTAPGIPLPGGLAILPLNWDAFTDFVIVKLNGPVFNDFLGVLNASGQGAALLDIPVLGPAYLGKLFLFAFLLEGTPNWDFVSNPMGVVITP